MRYHLLNPFHHHPREQSISGFSARCTCPHLHTGGHAQNLAAICTGCYFPLRAATPASPRLDRADPGIQPENHPGNPVRMLFAAWVTERRAELEVAEIVQH